MLHFDATSGRVSMSRINPSGIVSGVALQSAHPGRALAATDR